MKKICLIEDDFWISNSLKLYLENTDFEVLLYHTWKWAAEFVLKQDPDLCILDINLPEISGIDVCKQIRITSEVPIVMLTARWWEHDRINGLESGADDYIAKPFSPRELLARLQALLRRHKKENINEEKNIISLQDIKIYTDTWEVKKWEELISFTKNEYDILLKIAEWRGKIVSREILMKEVIWYENYVYDRTIDTHIKNIRKKLWDNEYIITVRWIWYKVKLHP